MAGFFPLFPALVLLKRGSLFERFDDSLPRRFPNGKVLYAASRTRVLADFSLTPLSLSPKNN